MVVYHVGKHIRALAFRLVDDIDRPIVLFKLNPGTSDEKIAELKAAGEAMVGQVPGSSSPAGRQ